MKMFMNNTSDFSTKDIYLAATLLTIGYSYYTLKKEDRIFYFIFDNPDGKIELQVDEYWAGNILVDPKALFNSFRELKGRMYGNKKGQPTT